MIALFHLFQTPPVDQIAGLTTIQSLIVSLLVVPLAQAIILAIASQKGAKVNKSTASVIVFVVSIVLGYLFSGVISAFHATDFSDFTDKVLAMGSQVAGYAVVIYSVVMSKVFDKIGLNQEVVLPSNAPDLGESNINNESK